MKKYVAVAVISAGMLGALASSANAAIVQDGDFSSPWGGVFTTVGSGNNFGPWNVTSGSVDLIGSYWQSATLGGGSVDLDGSFQAGTISQNLLVGPGSYVLHFSLSGNPDGGDPLKGVQVSVGSALQNFFYTTGGNSHGSMNYLTESLAFTTTGPTSLVFSSLDSAESAWGAVISGVSVSSVPLPAGLPMLMTSILGLFGFRARKQQLEAQAA